MDVTCINTQDVAPAERFDLFYETVSRRLMPMTPRCAPCTRDFPARLVAAGCGTRGAMLIEAPAHFVRRGGAEIRAGDPELVYLGCMLGGSRWLLNEVGENRLRRGSLFLTASGRPFTLDGARGRYTGVTLALPRADLRGIDLASLSDPNFLDQLPTRDLLRHTLVRAASALETDAAGELAFLCSVALGAVTLGLGGSRACTEAEARPKVTSELVRLEIARSLGDTDLTAERVAARVGLSVRALQRALAREGLSFRGLLREQRMRAAYDALVNTAEPIDRIAVACGYLELSSFYRVFRRHFDMTPVQVRSLTPSATSGGVASPRYF